MEKVLLNTEHAVADLGRQITEIRASTEDKSEGSKSKTGEAEKQMARMVLGDCWAVRINSGKFGVEWNRTKAVLEQGAVDMRVIEFAEPDIVEEK